MAFGRKEEAKIPEVLSRLPEGGIVLDIGAHIGGFSLIAAKAVGSSGRVFAFEPVLPNLQLLEQNASLNNLDWIMSFGTAVGRKSGSVELFVSDVDTTLATTRESWADVLHHGNTSAHVTSQQVPVVSVDDFVREHSIPNITLMKVDVEAAEMEVLAGAAETLAAGRVEQLIIEVHGPTVKWDHVVGILRGYGYRTAEIGDAELHAVFDPSATRKGQVRIAGNKPVSVALVGCGAVSEYLYAAALDALGAEGLTEAAALVDPNPARMSKIGQLLATAQHYRDLETMLKEITPELAIVATPPRFHAELTVACLERGSHVLCEKPMALSTVDCDQMIELAKKNSRILAVGHFRRFYPSSEIIKDILESGMLGAIRNFRIQEGSIYSWPSSSASFLKRIEAGGGMLIDQGTHTIDLLLWWLGDVRKVWYCDDFMGGVEANCHMNVTMQSGAEGFLQLSRDWTLPNRYVIHGENGWIEWACDKIDTIKCGVKNSRYRLGSRLQLVEKPLSSSVHEREIAVNGDYRECFKAQLRNVIASIRGRDRLRVSGADARPTVALIEQCYRERKLLIMPWLTKSEISRAQELANV